MRASCSGIAIVSVPIGSVGSGSSRAVGERVRVAGEHRAQLVVVVARRARAVFTASRSDDGCCPYG